MKSKIDIYVASKILEKRKELGISQRGIASILECSPGFVGQVESEKSATKYSVHQLFLIAQHMECAPTDFFPPLEEEI